jgi:hypothetical protein
MVPPAHRRRNEGDCEMLTKISNPPPMISAGLDPWQREHEMADALLRLLIAHSRYGVERDADRLGLMQHIVVLLAQEVAERVERLLGKDAARAFRRCLARKEPPPDAGHRSM